MNRNKRGSCRKRAGLGRRRRRRWGESEWVFWKIEREKKDGFSGPVRVNPRVWSD